MSEATRLLEMIAGILDRWADESERGGWSTHQVDEQRKLADAIRRDLARMRRPGAAT